MSIVESFKSLLGDISKVPNQTISYKALGLECELTSNPEKITELYKNPNFTRAKFSRRMVEHLGALDGLVTQNDDKAIIKRELTKKYYSSTRYRNRVNELCENINSELKCVTDEQFLELHHLLFKHLNIFFLKNLFGVDLKEADINYINSIELFKCDKVFNTSFSKSFFLNVLPLPKFIKEKLDSDNKIRMQKMNLICDYINQNCNHIKDSYYGDLISLKQQKILTEEDVIGECRMSFINASSLAVSLMWAIYCLSENKQYIKDVIESDNYSKLAYLEVLRMYPPFHMLGYEEKSKCPFHFGYKKTFVISVLGTHNSEKNWTEPERFNPNRFSEGLSKIKKGTFIPFGGGSRVCPGSGVAMILAPKILSNIFLEFDVVVNEQPIKKRRVEFLPLNNSINFTFRIK